jgi:hypothetical protein
MASKDETNYTYIYDNIHVLFRHTNITPSLDMNSFELFEKYLEQVSNNNLNNNNADIKTFPPHEQIKLCLEENIIKFNDDTTNNSKILTDIETKLNSIKPTDIKTTKVLEAIKQKIPELKDPSSIYFIQYKLFTHKEFIIYNILNFLSSIDIVEKINYQWHNNIEHLKNIFNTIKLNIDEINADPNEENTNSKEKFTSFFSRKSSNVFKAMSNTYTTASKGVSSFISSKKTLTGGVILTELDYIKERIKLKISLITPKEKLFYH